MEIINDESVLKVFIEALYIASKFTTDPVLKSCEGYSMVCMNCASVVAVVLNNKSIATDSKLKFFCDVFKEDSGVRDVILGHVLIVVLVQDQRFNIKVIDLLGAMTFDADTDVSMIIAGLLTFLTTLNSESFIHYERYLWKSWV